MSFNYYFNITIIYIFLGILVAFTAVFIFKKHIMGKFWGALAIAVFGSFLGGVMEYLLKDVIEYLTNVNGSVNIFPPLITGTILVMIFSRISDKRDDNK